MEKTSNFFLPRQEILSGLIPGIIAGLLCLLPGTLLPYLIPVIVVVLILSNYGFNGWIYLSLVILVSFPDGIMDFIRPTAQALCFSLVFGRYLITRGLKIPQLIIEDIPLQKTIAVMLSCYFGATLLSQSFSGSMVHYTRLFVFVVLLTLLGEFARDRKIRVVYIWALLSIGIVGSLFTISTFLSNAKEIQKLLTSATVEEGGLFGNRAALGLQLVIAYASGLYLLYSNLVSDKKRIRLLIKTGLFLIVLALIIANSRGAILAFGAFNLIFLYLIDRKKFVFIVSTASFITVAYYIIPGVDFIVNSYFRADRISQNTRLPLWEFAYNVFRDHIFSGVGPGMFKYQLSTYLTVDMYSFDGAQIVGLFNLIDYGHAHNFYLFTLSETGILGFSGAVTLIGFYAVRSYRLNKKGRELSQKNPEVLGAAALAIIIGLLIRGMVDSAGMITYGWLTRDVMYWLLMFIVMNEYKNLPVALEK